MFDGRQGSTAQKVVIKTAPMLIGRIGRAIASSPSLNVGTGVQALVLAFDCCGSIAHQLHQLKNAERRVDDLGPCFGANVRKLGGGQVTVGTEKVEIELDLAGHVRFAYHDDRNDYLIIVSIMNRVNR